MVMTKSKMTIEKLAEMTQEQFSQVQEQFSRVDDRLDRLETGQERIEAGLKQVLDVVLEIPSRKVFDRTQARNEARFVVIEKKIGI